MIKIFTLKSIIYKDNIIYLITKLENYNSFNYTNLTITSIFTRNLNDQSHYHVIQLRPGLLRVSDISYRLERIYLHLYTEI